MFRFAIPLLVCSSLVAQNYTPVVVETFNVTTSGRGRTTTTTNPIANWLPNIFRPAIFQVALQGTNYVVRHGVNAADYDPTPTSNEADTNNQGMRLPVNLVGNAQAVSIQMYVPSTWQGQLHNAGLWAEGLVQDGSQLVTWSLPKLVYLDDGDGVPGIYGLDDNLGTYVPLLTGSQFQYDRYHQLTIVLRDGLITYFVNGRPIYKYLDAEFRPGLRSTKMGAAILSTYNFGTSHELFWDNFYASGDFDNDGLDNRTEDLGVTSPTNPDTDADTLLDGSEVDLGSNPVVPDTDGDGLLDGYEVSTVGTDPTKADTDADGVNDRLDDRPLVKGVSTNYLATAARDLSADLTTFPLTVFVGSTTRQQQASRNKISNDLQAAAQRLEGRRPSQAASLLASAETNAKALMVDGTEKNYVVGEIQLLRALLAYGF
ncbi:MAG: hypothetical protein RL148_2597 [Planctomycetota bacterium]